MMVIKHRKVSQVKEGSTERQKKERKKNAKWSTIRMLSRNEVKDIKVKQQFRARTIAQSSYINQARAHNAFFAYLAHLTVTYLRIGCTFAIVHTHF